MQKINSILVLMLFLMVTGSVTASEHDAKSELTSEGEEVAKNRKLQAERFCSDKGGVVFHSPAYTLVECANGQASLKLSS
jgi:hypothetical protein